MSLKQRFPWPHRLPPGDGVECKTIEQSSQLYVFSRQTFRIRLGRRDAHLRPTSHHCARVSMLILSFLHSEGVLQPFPQNQRRHRSLVVFSIKSGFSIATATSSAALLQCANHASTLAAFAEDTQPWELAHGSFCSSWQPGIISHAARGNCYRYRTEIVVCERTDLRLG